MEKLSNMRRKKVFLGVILIIFIVFIVATAISLLKLFEAGNNKLVGTGFNRPLTSTPTPLPLPPQSPKTFKLDASTELEVELQKVNPQVLDSDFE